MFTPDLATKAAPGRALAVPLLALLLVAAPSAQALQLAPDVFVDVPSDPSDPYLSLREAVAKANATPGKDVIKLKAGNYALTKGMAPGGPSPWWSGDGRLTITEDLDIEGQGATSTSLRMMIGAGGSRDRFLDIAAGVSVTIKGVSIGAGSWGGKAERGGAILNAGSLTLNGCYVAGNTATLAGGAILNRGQLTVTGTVFQYNQTGRDGGAVFNDLLATATFTDTTFDVNTAGYAMQTYGGHGGGLFNGLAATATIRNSKMTSNHATGTLGGHGGFGGAVYNFWGTVRVINGGVTNNVVHRLVSPGSYQSLVENYAGAPVWLYYELAPSPPPWPPQPMPWP